MIMSADKSVTEVIAEMTMPFIRTIPMPKPMRNDMKRSARRPAIDKLSTTLDDILAKNPANYAEYMNSLLDFIKENEESYRLAINASDLTIFTSKLKNIFSKRMSEMETPYFFSDNYEKRTVQVYFIVSACVDTVIRYLSGNLASSLDLVGEVIAEAVEKLKG